MKLIKLAVIFILTFFTITVFASVSVHGYTKGNGTYVTPHHRSDPNSTRLDNWSTKGNINPYTGKAGDKNP
jgi:hypothetical protein